MIIIGFLVCAIISFFLGFMFGAHVMMYAIEKRAIEAGSDLLLKIVRSFKTKKDDSE
jgi:hypothetical protein